MSLGELDTSHADVLALPDGEPVKGASLISAHGRVALQETRVIEREALEAAVAGRRSIVLDLTDVTQLGPGLLGGILRMRRGLGAIGGRLVLVVDGPPADALVRVSVIQALVDVVPTIEDAAALLGPGGPRLRRSG
jgi:anti-anti-sigma regulatory factor